MCNFPEKSTDQMATKLTVVNVNIVGSLVKIINFNVDDFLCVKLKVLNFGAFSSNLSHDYMSRLCVIFLQKPMKILI